MAFGALLALGALLAGTLALARGAYLGWLACLGVPGEADPAPRARPEEFRRA